MEVRACVVFALTFVACVLCGTIIFLVTRSWFWTWVGVAIAYVTVVLSVSAFTQSSEISNRDE